MEETLARQKSEFREHLEHLKKIGQLTEEEVEQIWKSEGMMEPESDVEQVQVWRRWDHGRISWLLLSKCNLPIQITRM